MTATANQGQDNTSIATSGTKPTVAVVYTRPDTVIKDVERAMLLADYKSHLPKTNPTLLKINISWQHYYPACSTTPWQLEGVIKTLRENDYDKLIPTHNGTVVVDPIEGALQLSLIHI